MGVYTQNDVDHLDERIEEELRTLTKRLKPHCDAGVLVGSYGRGEGAPFVAPSGKRTPFDGFHLVVIIETVNSAVRILFENLEDELSAEIGRRVVLSPFARPELPDREFSLFNAEIKAHHKVLWGSEDALAALPEYDCGRIPASEGARLLLNRGKTLLDLKRRLASGEALDAEERVRAITSIHEIWLGFGEAALLAERAYAPTLAEKRERVARIGACPERDQVVAGFLAAIELKENGDYARLEQFNIPAEMERVIAVFERFMPWYRGLYASRECSMLKAIALNLKWNKRFSTRHPREALYDAIVDLLRDHSTMSHQLFYELQRKFA